MTNVIIYSMEFNDWLNEEMRKRGLSQNQLAKKAGVTQGAISHIIAGRRLPGVDLLDGISRALKIPPEEVYRRAGLLPQKSPYQERIERIYYKLSTLDEQDRQQVEDYIEFLLSKKEGEGRNENHISGFKEVK